MPQRCPPEGTGPVTSCCTPKLLSMGQRCLSYYECVESTELPAAFCETFAVITYRKVTEIPKQLLSSGATDPLESPSSHASLHQPFMKHIWYWLSPCVSIPPSPRQSLSDLYVECIVVWFMMCLYLDARHKRNNYPSFSFVPVSLFTVPWIFGSQRYWGTEALHWIYNACALSMHPDQLVDGIRCVGCLPGVTAEQKHLAVVHKDLQKNEEGLGTDDWRRTLQRADYLHNKILQRGVQAVSAVLLAHMHHLKRPGGLWTFSVA